jgi:hypothetical protein
MVDTITSRRAVLAGVAAAPATVLLSLSPANAAGRTSNVVDRTAWDQLLARYRDAKVAYDRAARIYNDREGQFFKLCPPRPEMPEYVARITDGMTWGEVKKLPECPQRLAWERECAAWADQRAALNAEIVGSSEQDASDAMDALNAPLWEIASYPVPTLAMLAEKIDVLSAEYGTDMGNGAETKHIIADVLRLSGREG